MAKFLYKHRRGTTEQWANKGNGIKPEEGEIVIELDKTNNLHKLKIGDGIHTYSELAYLMAGDEIVSQVLPRVVTVTLDVNKWTLVEGKPYYGQSVDIGEITVHSRLDLQPSADMLAEFQSLNLVFVTENNGEAITVYSVGAKPLKTYVMQATIVETSTVQECVIGTPVGTPTANADWNQNDETKADYIKNKPNVEALSNRVTNLEKAAMGNIYETTEVVGSAYTIQLSNDTANALPYGVLSRVYGKGRWIDESVAEGDWLVAPGSLVDLVDENGILIDFECNHSAIGVRAEYENTENVELVVCLHFFNPDAGSWNFDIDVVMDDSLATKSVPIPDGADLTRPIHITLYARGEDESVINVSRVAIQHLVPTKANKIEMGLPYTLEGTTLKDGEVCEVNKAEGTIIMPEDAIYYVKIPCVLPSGTKVRVYAEGDNGTKNGKVSKFDFLVGNTSVTSGNIALGSQRELTSNSEYLAIYKQSPTDKLTADLEIKNIRVILEDPNAAKLYDVVYKVDIPEDIYTLDGYGDDGNYIDLTERKFYQYYNQQDELAIPVIKDISEHFVDDVDIIPIRPDYLIRFSNTDGAKYSVPYSLYYKTKITQ